VLRTGLRSPSQIEQVGVCWAVCIFQTMTSTEEAVFVVIIALACFLAVTVLALVVVDVWERRIHGGLHGWHSFRFADEVLEGKLVSSASSNAEVYEEEGENADDSAAKSERVLARVASVSVQNLRPDRVRNCVKVLLILWSFMGVGISVFLVFNFLEFLQDANALEEELFRVATQETTETFLATFDEDGNQTDGFSLFSDTFLLPAPHAPHILEKFFREVSPEELVSIYGVDWVGERCRGGTTCASVDQLLAVSTATFTIVFVAAPNGPDTTLIRTLIAALALDSFTFFFFGCLVALRYREGKMNEPKRRRMTMLIEVLLLVLAIVVLIALIVLALVIRPIQYASLAYVSPFGSVSPIVVLEPKTRWAVTERRSFNFVFEAETPEALEWCIPLGQQARIKARFDVLEGDDGDIIMTGDTTPTLGIGCYLTGGVKNRLKIADADFYEPLIEYIQDQVIQQGLVVDSLLIAIDVCVLVASYLFLIL